MPNGLQEDAPVLSLFDNAVIARGDEIPEPSPPQPNKYKLITQELKSLLPGPRELDVILDMCSRWWDNWRQLFPEILDLQNGPFKESVQQSLRSENPAQVAKMIICIAICIDQLPGTYDCSQLQLEGSRFEVIERYIARVDELITPDDEIAGTIEGIECMCLQSKHYANVGRPRKSWLVHSRAISFAQLLGLHRVALVTPKQPDVQHYRRLSLWSHLFLGERYLGLTLGLPLTIQPRFCDPLIPHLGQPGELSQSRIVLLHVSSIMAKIVDRNQDRSLDLSATFQIDEEMEELARAAPQDWWGKLDAPAPSVEENCDRVLSQFFYHLARKLLHMPFMLQKGADRRYQYPYAAALDSSREIIRCYDALRGTDVAVPFICKLVDFEAFCAATLILLHLYRHPRSTEPNTEQDRTDFMLVDKTIESLKNASNEAGGIVAQQAFKALQLFAQVRYGCRNPSEPPHTIKVSIPLFGTITLIPGSNFRYPEMSDGSCDAGKAGSMPAAAEIVPSGLPTPSTAPSLGPQASPCSLITPNQSTPSSEPVTVLPSPYSEGNIACKQGSQQQQRVKQTQRHDQVTQDIPSSSLPAAPIAAAANSDFLPNYPVISFDTNGGFDSGGNSLADIDPLYYGGNLARVDANGLGTAFGYTQGIASGMDPLMSSWYLDPSMDLDSDWNMTSFDQSAP